MTIDLKRRKFFLPALILLAIVTSWISSMDGGDFEVYLEAAGRLSEQQNIYEPPFIRGLQYYYSILFAVILWPFSSHVFAGEFIWLLLSWIWMYRIVVLSTAYFDLDALTEKQKAWWAFFVLLLTFQFLKYNISLIQVTFFLLWAILESLRLIEERKYITGGILLAIAINIKVMPVIMLAWLFYRGYFKALGVCLVFSVILIYLPAVFIGFDYNNFLLGEWWKVINPSNSEHVFEAGIGTNGLSALVPVYLTPTVGDMPYPRNFASLAPNTVALIVNLARVLLLAASLLFLRTLPFKHEHRPQKRFWEIAYFLLIIPLLMPHQNKYNLLLSAPMIAWILYYFIRTFRFPQPVIYKIVFGLFIIVSLFYSPLYGSDILTSFVFRYTQHFRFLSVATLILIPIAYYCRPEKLIANENRQVN